jgi:hypothetical protein
MPTSKSASAAGFLQRNMSSSRRPLIVPALPLPLVKPRTLAVSPSASTTHKNDVTPHKRASSIDASPTAPALSPSTEARTEVDSNGTEEGQQLAPIVAQVATVAPASTPAEAEPATPSSEASRRASKAEGTSQVHLTPVFPFLLLLVNYCFAQRTKLVAPCLPTSANLHAVPETSTPASTASSDHQQVLSQPRVDGPLTQKELGDNKMEKALAEHMGRLSFTGFPPNHQALPSNGNFVVFGGFNDSSTASPAPLSAESGTYAPPPPPPYMDQPPMFGAYGMMPPGLPPSAVDAPPTTSTPHSLHGSQASLHGEDLSRPPHHVLNRSTYSAGADPLMAHPGPAPPPIDPLDDRMHEDAMFHLQHGFAEREFADCLLEIRLPRSSTDEVRDRRVDAHSRQPSAQSQATLSVPAHRFVLARSPTLRRRLHASGTLPDGVLLLYGDDRYLRADALYYAVRTLYGVPLGPVLPTYSPMQSMQEQFELALGYAATGRFLQLDLVLFKGVRTACQLLSWDTVEKAFEYALPGYIHPFSAVSSGESSNAPSRTPDVWAGAVRDLLNQALNFVVEHFPSDFMLDVESGNCAFGRLPSAFQAAPNPDSPPIARGTSILNGTPHSRQVSTSSVTIPPMPLAPTARQSRNPHLAGIKFGDMSDESPSGALAVTRLQPNDTDTFFSRILLNLPFELLKEVLEGPSLASRSGGITMAARHQAMLDIIQERESKRVRAVESLRRRTGPLHHYYKDRLSSFAAQPVDGESDYKANNMGLKEQVTQDKAETPILTQSWHRYDFNVSG